MRIMIQTDGSHPHKADGIVSVLEQAGHHVYGWATTNKPAFDAFDEYEPEIFIGSIDKRDTKKCLDERNGSVRFVSIDGIKAAADLFRFSWGMKKPEFKCQVLCVANEKIADEVINPLLDLNVKIVGPVKHSLPQYLGPVHQSTLRHLYASANVTLVLPNDKESVYNILASGGFPILFQPIPPEFNEWNIFATTDINKLHNSIRNLVDPKASAMMARLVGQARTAAKCDETYWHRVRDIFMGLGMEDEAQRILRVYNETSFL